VSPSDDSTPVLRARRSLLFFPATRPDQLEKAVRTGTDMVCIDLEDAVASDRKEEARAAALDLLRRPARFRAEIVLRINSPRTEDGLRDVLAVLEARVAPDALMVPKVESSEEVRWIEELLEPGMPAVRLIPMVETCRGLEHATGIASASPRVSAVMLGGVDLSAELGCALEWDALLYARSRVVHAAKLAGVDLFDMPFLDVADADGLAAEARAAARLGFTGKAAIHPAQLPPILAAFSPGAAEIARAREVVAAYERNRGGVLLVDGRLVERPVIRAAHRTLALAAAMGTEQESLGRTRQESVEEHRSGPSTESE
jgi:(S)-citramalyl-CoA lyase